MTNKERDDLLKRISVDPQVMVGKPVIRGTRLTVQFVLGLLASGQSIGEILSEYEGLAREDVFACLLFATQVLDTSSFVPLRPEAAQLRFLVDECTGPAVARWLSAQGHDVVSIFHTDRGVPDVVVLARALAEDRVLVTNDKDFGEMIFREGRAHRGVILLRLVDERAAAKIQVLRQLLHQHADQLADNFVVASEESARIVHLPHRPS